MNRALWCLALCVAGLWGCGEAAVRTSRKLPVKKVVLYRSGVGYFERAGEIDGEELTFRVRASDVGDFLSSLTAVDAERPGSVRSVSFQSPEPKEPPPPDAEGEGEDGRSERRYVDITLHLEDGAHDLVVAYVVGTPLWRPSYRFVFDDERGLLLQAWAIVQNTSGEDWRDVYLSLTTGAPIAFRSDLGTPIEPPRPLVTDRGELITEVPGAEVAVQQESLAAGAAPEREPAADEALERAPARKRGAQASAPAPAPPSMSADTIAEAVRPVALLADAGENVTRYDIAEPTTVPDEGATMVAVLSQRVAGEQALLYAPQQGVATSGAHPFKVARVVNDTGAVLERGPVSVLRGSAFLGHGVLETLPAEATAFLPFAVDKAVVVEAASKHAETEGRLVRVQRGRITVERFSERKTRYEVRNGGEAEAKVYVRHDRWRSADLVEPPEGTELTPASALVPLEVQSSRSETLTLRERTPVRREVDFMSTVAAEAVALWLSGPAVDATQGQALRQALQLRTQLLEVQERLRGDRRRREELVHSAEETRSNLKSIEKIKSAKDLRTRLLERLDALDSEIANLTQSLVEAETRESELRVRLDEVLDGVTLTTTPGSK